METLLFQQPEYIGMGFANMKNDWLVVLTRKLKLAAKKVLLLPVKIRLLEFRHIGIQADFPNSHAGMTA